MITAVIKDSAANVIYTVQFFGFELLLGTILGGIACIVIWANLKSFGK